MDEKTRFIKLEQAANACRAIDEAIKNATTYGPMPGTSHVDVKKAGDEVIKAFGAELIKTITAVYVEAHGDARISDAGRKWAKIKAVMTAAGEDAIIFYDLYAGPGKKPIRCYLNTHHAILDGFVDYIRQF